MLCSTASSLQFLLRDYVLCFFATQEFEGLWPLLDLVVDGGRITESEEPSSRRGSTVVDLSRPGKFSIIREGRLEMKTKNHTLQMYYISAAAFFSSSYEDTVKLLKDTCGLTELSS